MALAVAKVSRLKRVAGQTLDRFFGVARPGDGKRASFESRCCPQVLFRRRRFYSKGLLLGAFASEAARQLTSFSG